MGDFWGWYSNTSQALHLKCIDKIYIYDTTITYEIAPLLKSKSQKLKEYV